ncbi:hypothetical protein [Parasphingorhabdus sp.]|uniref:MarR family winged helix-turn-helix transcriptional regulator n=1 Tax=Parasphingorhabdus sp. TaxID=2709688 RepID=UPI0032636D5E
MELKNRPFYERLSFDEAFVGARALRLTELIGRQGDEFFQDVGLTAPSRTTSTILFIDHNGPSSLVEIARGLGEQHQLTAQRTTLLEDLSIIKRKPDPNDQRRKIFHLTKRGAAEVVLIEARCREAINVFDDLNNELGFNLGVALDAAQKALSQRSMMERLKTTSDEAKLETAHG